jgi:small-conductance mechanosensitive channel
MAVAPQAASVGFSGGTFGLSAAQAAPGVSLDSRLSLSGGLRAGALLAGPAPSVKLSAEAPAAAAAPQLAAALLPALLVSAALPQSAPTAPLAAVSADMQQAQAILRGNESPSAAPASPAASKQSWDSFWSRGQAASAPADVDAGAEAAASQTLSPASRLSSEKPAIPAPSQPAAAAKSRHLLRTLAAPLAAAALWAGSQLSASSRLPGFWVKTAPYLTGAGILLAARVLDAAARRGVDLLAARLHWKPGTVTAAHLGVRVLAYAAGGALALHAVGVSTAALLTTCGVGGVAMTMAAKDFIGNFLEGVKILLTHPFVIGDRVKIGAQAYTVRDMDLRYLSLTRPDGGVTMMTYSQLSDQTITIFREYARRRLPAGLSTLWSGMGRLVKARPSLLKASAWTALGVGLAVALPFLPALLLPVHALTLTVSAGSALPAWLGYVQGGLTLLATHALGRGAVGFLRRIAESRGWQPQHAVLLKLAVQLGVSLVGGTVALHFFGLTWSALLKSLGATSIAVGWASSDVIGNLIQGFWILASHPFAIGDQIEVGAVSGTVADMNLSYVVLEHADKSHTLVPYAVLKASPFTVLSKAPLAGAAQ